MSMEGSPLQEQEKITLGDVMRKYNFTIGEVAGTYNNSEIKLSSEMTNQGWNADQSFTKDTNPSTLQGVIDTIISSGKEVKITTVEDSEGESTMYVVLFREIPNLETINNLPAPIVLTTESTIPTNLSKLNMSVELRKLLYTDTTEVSEYKQIQQLITLGHTIVFQSTDGTEGLYYLQKETDPEFVLSEGKKISQALQRIQAHLQRNNPK